ncbi:hypothetical protein [Williamsia sp. CHRR-6]|uniref:hypothetical protein n=1 Tax=Williamsia sp. CHRR-6 TaxID=2835871 RepID=UPI001BDA4B62|nr:hypothetical protein [Williamsia sp. CHRR-6]MBT0566074.1 hypothetical protein [Williamsia sp. CHRR-6]
MGDPFVGVIDVLELECPERNIVDHAARTEQLPATARESGRKSGFPVREHLTV